MKAVLQPTAGPQCRWISLVGQNWQCSDRAEYFRL